MLNSQVNFRLLPCTGKIAVLALGGILFSLCGKAKASTAPELATRDIKIALSAGPKQPHAVWIAGAGMTLRNRRAETLPPTVTVGGAVVPVSWAHKADLDFADGKHVEFVYETENPQLRLRWQWSARAGSGPVEHTIVVENHGDKEVWLPMIDSLQVDWAIERDGKLTNLYLEKGGDSPSGEGKHVETVADGYKWTGKSSTYELPLKGMTREIIPAEIVSSDNGSGWYAGIEFSGRTRISLERASGSLQSTLGLDPEPGPFSTRVAPGGSFETPTVFLGAFGGGADGAGNQLRPWVREVLGNPLTWKDEHYPLVVNNSWGSGMQVDEPLALRMIGESKELGVEMFHVDAGWFRGVGDWYPDEKKFPHGLDFIADAAHREGLRFGIWVDWTQAALDTQPGALNVRDAKVRDWMVTDLKPDWKPEEFKGQTIDLGVPEAHDYFYKEVKRIVESYHLDMLEHDGYLVAKGCVREDHPHAPPDHATMRVQHDWGSDFVSGSNSTDVSYHAVQAYYDIYARTRKEHPGLIFEICNDGGRMVDFGSAAHGDYFSITDTYDPLSNRRAFYDTSYLLPPAMLESYVEKWPTPKPENFLYMLRSGMMGWVTLMLDTSSWTQQQHDAARNSIALYKSRLRPLIRDAQLFHISDRPNGIHWDGMEYVDPKQGNGVVFAFRGSGPDEDRHRFVLGGLEPGHRYRLHFEDGTSQDREALGSELMSKGLEVTLASPLSSELVFLDREP